MKIIQADNSTQELVRQMSERGFARQLRAVAFDRSPMAGHRIKNVLELFSDYTLDVSFVFAYDSTTPGTWIFEGTPDSVHLKVQSAHDSAHSGKPKRRKQLLDKLSPLFSELFRTIQVNITYGHNRNPTPPEYLIPCPPLDLDALRSFNPHGWHFYIRRVMLRIHKIIFQPGVDQSVVDEAVALAKISEVIKS